MGQSARIRNKARALQLHTDVVALPDIDAPMQLATGEELAENTTQSLGPCIILGNQAIFIGVQGLRWGDV